MIVMQIALYMIFSGLAFLIFSIYIRRELGELRIISEGIDQISLGNYSHQINVHANNELSKIANTLNEISSSFSGNIKQIEDHKANDSLTGLLNSSKITELMQSEADFAKDNGTKLAIVFIDLDNFKWINDTMGHKFGDETLKAFSELLTKSIGAQGICGRFGGDEFIILIPFQSDISEVSLIVENLRKTSSLPMNILGENFYIKYSIGVSAFPDDDSEIENVLRNADIAANNAKADGKDQVKYYSLSQLSSVSSKTSIAQSLNQALSNGELYLNYQPIAFSKTGEIYGFEALVRWRSSELGLLPPQEFISIAEETGMIIPIGKWILETAFRFTKKIVAEIRPNIIMSINVSAQQLRQPDFVEYVKEIIELTGVDTKNLQFEITESLFIEGLNDAQIVLNEINDLGIKIALDDFGTGYCSFNYLKRLPIASLKIDKTFVNDILTNQRDYNITGSIIDLVHNFDIKTIAEGVESQEQLNALVEMDCDYIQGYVIEMPLSETDVIGFIEANLASE